MRKSGCTCPTHATLDRVVRLERRLKRALAWGFYRPWVLWEKLERLQELQDDLQLRVLLCPAHAADVRLRALSMLRVD